MIQNSLPPLSAVASLPLEVRFGTPEGYSDKRHLPAQKPSTGVEGWLLALQDGVPDRRIHLHARVHPAQLHDPSAVLQLQGLRRAVASAVDLLAAPVPHAQRAMLDTVLRVTREGQQLDCSVRVAPRSFRYFSRRALARLDLANATADATEAMASYWYGQLAWLRRSGIVALEVRASLQCLAWS